ncbi:TPA: hypothetical protein ACTL7P_000224 [Pseudomonas aeruginosa]|uniref:hypothetical protein n=1 Tax=Pseudomonas aeruginosa TaxID=287 RepID=UPI001AAF4A6F|nr:hypothetical protein [Pseudomonas aeruginosa]EKX9247928.1 hypothetical protein [Pseudomonas aeruginosa]MBO2857305.1 hypothetical protein [Pseudomonas aeruginosa]MBO2936688.1 hypothetical protein [Pseudomonas aeruginosa]MBO8395504.1 hypothetical protein [Pseudomonas aeruginosa]MCO2630801.1 hypothetical protein [Pseudomonas aeruginosa]
MTAEDKAIEAKARYVAQKHGYFAIKSTKRTLSAENGGGFMLVQAATNRIEAGERFDMSAEQVITFFGGGQV